MSSPNFEMAKIMALNDPINSAVQQKGGIKRKLLKKSMPLPSKRVNKTSLEKEQKPPFRHGLSTRSKVKQVIGFQLPDAKPLDAQELKFIRGWEPPKCKAAISAVPSQSAFHMPGMKDVSKTYSTPDLQSQHCKTTMPVWQPPLLKNSSYKDNKPEFNNSQDKQIQNKNKMLSQKFMESQVCNIFDKNKLQNICTEDKKKDFEEIIDSAIQQDINVSTDDGNEMDELNFSPTIENSSIVENEIVQPRRGSQFSCAEATEQMDTNDPLGGDTESFQEDTSYSQDMFANEDEQDADHYPPMKKTTDEIEPSVHIDYNMVHFTPPNKVDFAICSLPTVKNECIKILIDTAEKDANDVAEIINEDIDLEDEVEKEGVVYGANDLSETGDETYFSPVQNALKIDEGSKDNVDNSGEENNVDKVHEKEQSPANSIDINAINNDSQYGVVKPLELSLPKENMIVEQHHGEGSTDMMKISSEKSQNIPTKISINVVNKNIYNSQKKSVLDVSFAVEENKKEELLSKVASQVIEFMKPTLKCEIKHDQEDSETTETSSPTDGMSYSLKNPQDQKKQYMDQILGLKDTEEITGENMTCDKEESGSKEFNKDNTAAGKVQIVADVSTISESSDTLVTEDTVLTTESNVIGNQEDKEIKSDDPSKTLNEDKNVKLKPCTFDMEQDFDISATQLIQMEDAYKHELSTVFSKPPDPKTTTSNQNKNVRDLTAYQNVGRQPHEASIAPGNSSASCGEARGSPAIPLMPHIIWAKKAQEDRLKLKSAIAEITQLNAMLTQVRREVWPPQQNRPCPGVPPSGDTSAQQGSALLRRY